MDERFFLDRLYIDENISNELFECVQHGLCSQLNTRLHELENSIQYLRIVRKYKQEQVSLLMIATLNGYDDIVRVLLTYDNSIDQVELKGQINIYNNVRIDGATALYCACYCRHFTIAKTLIEFGQANVNQDTDDYPYYSLFLHATISNRRDIIEFLIENKYADVNETKSYDIDKSTVLIWAAFRGHTFLVEYLIANGADINYSCSNKNLQASTPINCAVIAGHVDSVRLLYNAGANTNIKNIYGDTLLTMAIKHNHHSIIDFLLEESINTIDDLELAACSLIKISSSIVQMYRMLKLLKIALQRRKLSNTPKFCIESKAAYDYEQECQTLDELKSIKDNRNRIFLETLLIRERISLSRNDISILKPLHDYGDMLVEQQEFNKCLNIWIHMFYLYQQMKISTILHRFVWLFCRMLRNNSIIPVNRFIQVCRLVFEPSQINEKTLTIFNALFLVTIATKILEQEGISEAERISIYSWIKDLCRYQLTTTDNKTLLHLCVDVHLNEMLSFRPNDTSQYLKFPNESALRLLLTCGNRWLDLDAIESSNGNTPLHLICQGTGDQQIIKLLLKSGCHIDCVNKSGDSPVNYIKNMTSESSPLKLKCLCAHMIVNQQLNTDSLGPSTSTLNKFIVLHGRHSIKKIS